MSIIKFLHYHEIPFDSTMTLINIYPEGLIGQPWHMWSLSRNSNLDWKIVRDHPEGFNGKSWVIHEISRNPHLRLEICS